MQRVRGLSLGALLLLQSVAAQATQPSAALKRVYRVDFGQVDNDGFLVKTLVADLLHINDPLGPAREARGEEPDNSEFVVIKVAALWE